MSDDQDKLLDHEYDGIQELNNKLPTWWLWTFYITIVFGVGYWVYYSFLSGPTLDQELAQGMTRIEQMRGASASQDGGEMDEATMMANGQKHYNSYCAACHKADGGGSVGPNLTDNFWVHGTGDEETVKKVIVEGILDKGMPAWKEVLKPNDIKAVVFFVMSLKGKNVPDGKAPQGNEVN